MLFPQTESKYHGVRCKFYLWKQMEKRTYSYTHILLISKAYLALFIYCVYEGCSTYHKIS